MRVLTFDDEAAAAAAAASRVAEAAAMEPELVLGLPTGRTAIPLYDALAALHDGEEIDLSRARAFNLDELLLPPGHSGSFRAFMERHAWERIGLDRARCAIPDAGAPDPDAEAARYDAALAAAGGLDLAVLGIGADGHVAYNLPGGERAEAHVVEVPEEVANTLDVPVAERPLRAITLGLGALAAADRVVLLATTAEKARAVRALVAGPRDEAWPCTALRDHPALEVLLTPAAAAELA